MKRSMAFFITLLMVFGLIASNSLADTIDFSSFDLKTLVEMRTQLEKTIAEKQVSQSSTLSPKQSFDGEILFRSIPWYSSVEDVKKKLVADGMIDSSKDIDNDDYMYAWKIDEDMPIQSHAGANIAVYSFPSTFKVAGYSLSAVQIYCPYGYTEQAVDRTIAGTQFQLAELKFEVTDVELVFADLTNKLSSLYGTPETVEDNNHYIVFSDSPNYTQYNLWNVWYGANNTGVFLYKTYNMDDDSTTVKGASISLVYGKTDGKAYLDGLQQAVENEKKQQDQLIQQQNADNVDGL